jgi:RNA polymerase sigma factor (sigma-70 family)
MNADVLESIIQAQLPAAARGDHAAYGRIVAGCQGMVTAIALSIVRDVPASEDIAQDAFLKAWQNLRKLGNPASFLPWLRQITRNLARDHLRAQSYRANPPGDIEAVIAAVADPGLSPDDALSESQEARIAAGVIDALPEESREVLLLYYREGQSSRQVAALLGMQDAAVRKRLSRARADIRAELLQRLGEFARSSAPGAAFTAVVLGSLTIASPPAAAATIAIGGGALAGKGALKLLAGSLGGIGLGIAGALAGVWWGLLKYLRQPFDRTEFRALIRYGVSMTVLVSAFTVGITLATRSDGWFAMTAITLLYFAAVLWMANAWMPRILARRRAQELLEDPVAATAKRRKEKRLAKIGCIVGFTLGFGALVFGLIYTGRI